MWGPIIGAGISAIGSLFGGDDEETTMTINYKQMARKAEQAGFNPLTAIRNGGSAGFTTTHHPGLSMSSRFGQAFQTIGNAIMSFDARADERAELEQQLLRAQLGRIQRQSQLTAGMEVPTAAGSTRSSSPARGGAGGGVGGTGTPQNAGNALVTVTLPGGGTQDVANPDVVSDPESLLTGPLLKLANWWDRNQKRPPDFDLPAWAADRASRAAKNFQSSFENFQSTGAPAAVPGQYGVRQFTPKKQWPYY